MTATPDGFILNPVRNRTVSGLVGSKTIGLVLHVQAGNGALGGWFSNPAASASSTWWAGKLGQREQYGNPDSDKFWAQVAGNSTYHSIETEGYPNEPLTAEQIESVAVALAWGHARYGWPLALAEKPGDPGLGWHGMGGSAWGGHTGCPGDIRKKQRAQILARAKDLSAPQENDMDEVGFIQMIGHAAAGDTQNGRNLRNALQKIVTGAVGPLVDAEKFADAVVAKIPAGSADVAVVKQAVKDALKEGVA